MSDKEALAFLVDAAKAGGAKWEQEGGRRREDVVNREPYDRKDQGGKVSQKGIKNSHSPEEGSCRGKKVSTQVDVEWKVHITEAAGVGGWNKINRTIHFGESKEKSSKRFQRGGGWMNEKFLKKEK